MAQIEAQILAKLQQAFSDGLVQVLNESYMHNVPAGSESHFKVIVVSELFNGQRLLQRHRSINTLLADELAGPVHALAIHTYTPEEWQQNQQQFPNSPNCLGGNKL